MFEGDLAFGRGPTRFRPACIGDVVLVERPGIGLTVKRLIPGPSGLFGLRGDGGGSAPSVDLGHVAPDQIIAVLRWRLRRGWPTRVR
ncbi:S24/S26 family peptidase [Actibacterium sp. 188UL27-1]|nr:S24/S26 family peptidase [Actibacterium sp. 188UL27-1]